MEGFIFTNQIVNVFCFIKSKWSVCSSLHSRKTSTPTDLLPYPKRLNNRKWMILSVFLNEDLLWQVFFSFRDSSQVTRILGGNGTANVKVCSDNRDNSFLLHIQGAELINEKIFVTACPPNIAVTYSKLLLAVLFDKLFPLHGNRCHPIPPCHFKSNHLIPNTFWMNSLGIQFHNRRLNFNQPNIFLFQYHLFFFITTSQLLKLKRKWK